MKLTLPNENQAVTKWHKQYLQLKATKAIARGRARALRHALRKSLHPKHAQLAKGISEVATRDLFRKAANISEFKVEMNALIVYLNARKCPLPKGVDSIEAVVAERKNAFKTKYAAALERETASHTTSPKRDQLRQARAAEPVKAGGGFTQIH